MGKTKVEKRGGYSGSAPKVVPKPKSAGASVTPAKAKRAAA
jgi:hypothetical protein